MEENHDIDEASCHRLTMLIAVFQHVQKLRMHLVFDRATVVLLCVPLCFRVDVGVDCVDVSTGQIAQLSYELVVVLSDWRILLQRSYVCELVELVVDGVMQYEAIGCLAVDHC